MKRYLFIIFLGLIIFYLLIPLPVKLNNVDYSTVVTDTDGEILRVYLNSSEQWCLPVENESKIPQKLKTAALLFEDQYFYYHLGLNPISLVRAFYRNIQSDQIISGASTISMQVARITQPKARTYINKLFEIFQAVKLELVYSKEEILKLYFNYAPYGGNIIGYQAASLRYYKKIPDQLTWGEAATLAILPNAPGLISPTSNPNLLESKRNRLLQKLYESGILDVETFQLSIQEPIPNSSTPFNFSAPHLSQWLKVRKSSTKIKTTIRKAIQDNVYDILNRNVTYLNQLGIKNGAALVVETKSGKVRAYVGSQYFFDKENQGQVDGVLAARSSGSLLKPFLYALCIDEGIILPQTLIKDIPSFYGAFAPNNANGEFSGLIRAKDALVRSLNVPAVRLLYSYDVQPFCRFLKVAGMQTLFRSAMDYGLPLILGGAETSLWDMATLYRGLANGGNFIPLQITENPTEFPNVSKKNHLISAASSYLTLNILKELKRPGAEYYWHQYENQWPIAWKTGTSYGQRDGWAIGVTPQWTIAVWVGNFDGEGNANLSGARCAGPILFEIFNHLPKDENLNWFEKPEMSMQDIPLCLNTGFIVGEYCENKIVVEAPLHMKPMRICPYHERIYLTTDIKYSVCSLCWQSGFYKESSLLIYPADVAQFMREKGQIVTRSPQHKIDCPAQSESIPLEITYPQQWARLWLPRDFDGNLQKITMRVAHRDKNRKLYWYLDDQYIGYSIDKHIKSTQLKKGWHSLEVMDETGNSDQRSFFVDQSKHTLSNAQF
ncbi:penicillin-binding protein 1C [Calditrichota bacterium]